MKSTHLLLSVFLFSLSLVTYSQMEAVSWEQSFSISDINYFSDVVEDSEGGYTALGAKKKKGCSFDLWVVKMTSQGDTVWTQSFGSAHNEIPKRIIGLSDEGYMALGYTKKDSSKNSLLVKVDKNGTVVWEKQFQETLFIRDIVQLEDGTFVVAGSRYISKNEPRLWMAKMDASGEMVWEKNFREEMKGCVRSLKKLPDGGFAIACQVSEKNDNECDIMAIRTDEKGKAKWYSTVISPRQKAWPECICCSPDSCFIVVGWKGKCMDDINAESPVFDFDLVINKINCDGNIKWTKSFDRTGSEGGNAIAIRPDGNFIIAGIKATSYLGKVGPWLLKVDSEGNELDEKLLRFRFNNDHASRIINCSDGGFVVVGPGIQDDTNPRSTGWIIKFASN